MHPTIKFYSNKDGEIFRFLSKYYDINEKISQNFDIYYHSLEWQNSYENPIEIATILGVFADNMDGYEIAMWLCLDKGYYIKIIPNNADSIIRYLYERFPY